MEVKISIVVPTYKRPQLLLKCLNALLEQDFNAREFEIIVVSDGSDPTTAEVINKPGARHFGRIKYLSLPNKKGPAAARNMGWKSAAGDLIAFTDDDCLPDKNWLSAFYKAYLADRQSVFIGQTIVPVPQRPTDYQKNIKNLETADFITANCCCPKAALRLTGGFDERFTMAWREDSDLEFSMIRMGITISKITTAIVIHPVRRASWGVSLNEQKKTVFNALLYKKHPQLYRQKIQPTGPVLYYAIILACGISLYAILYQSETLSYTGLLIWLSLWMLFAFKRLKGTVLSASHIAEMLATSLLIPFLSVYWQFYGGIKYRVLFL